MGKTVRDILTLSIFKDAKIEAGKRGLDNVITNVTVLESSDPENFAYEILESTVEEGELVLSAFLEIKDDVEKQCKLIEFLHRSKSGAIVLFYIGFVVKKISFQVINLCNELEIPLISFNSQNLNIKYSEVISQVMEYIFLSDLRNENFINSIMKEISSIDKKNDFQSVLNILSKKTNLTFMFVSNLNKIIITSKKSNLDLIDFIEENMKTIISKFHMGKSELSIKNDSFDAQLIIKEIYIYKNSYKLIIINEQKNFVVPKLLIDSLYKIISIATNIYNYENFRETQFEFIDSLIKNNEAEIKLLSKELKIKIEDLILVIILDEKNPIKLDEIRFEIDKINVDSSFKKVEGLYNDKYLFLIFKTNNKNGIKEIVLHEIENILKNYGKYFLLKDIHNKNDLVRIINISIDEFENFKLAFVNEGVFTKYHAELMCICKKIMCEDKSNYDCYMRSLEVIKDYDKKNNSQLLDTFATLLIEANFDLKETGLILYLHQNTVKYRIKKINELINDNIDNNIVQNYYLIALIMNRISEK
ncbi:MAG: PucR family transcriptional regulator [Clostridioides sp.]|nr:PucR family transcriptional regulator [Clostridioides sp.]